MVRPSLVAILIGLLALTLPTQVAADAIVPPSPPMNVEVEETGDGASITWDPPAFDGGAEQLSYRVYRDDVLIADDLTTTAYLDIIVGEAATATHYTVTAVNEAGESMHHLGGVCIMLEGPTVDPDACVEFFLDIVFWAVDQLPP